MNRIDRKNHRLSRIGFAVLAGILLALSVPRIGMWPFAWLMFIPYLAALRGRSAFAGLFYGGVTGTVAAFISMSWVEELLRVFAHLPWYLSGLGLLLSSIAHGMPLAATGLLICILWRSGTRPMIAAPLALAASELLVPMVFPWMLSLSQQDVLLLIQISDLVGARGVSILVALGGATLYELATEPGNLRTRRLALYVAAFMVFVNIYGAVRLLQVRQMRLEAPTLRVGLVQGNLSIARKHDNRLDLINLALHQDISAELEKRGAELVIWPETAYPIPLRRGARTDEQGAFALRNGFQVPIIFGAETRDSERRRFNSALILDRDDHLSEPVDKNVLMMFGEHIPFYDDVPWAQQIFPQVWNFTPGEEPGILEMDELRAGVLNCYEDILPDFVRSLARKKPNLLVNITNDAWFGDTWEPHQHAALARYRAIEHRVDLVRAVNSGVSMSVSATGVITEETPVFVRTSLLTEVRLLEAGTLYTKVGDLLSWALTLTIPLLLVWSRRRRKSGAEQSIPGLCE